MAATARKARADVLAAAMRLRVRATRAAVERASRRALRPSPEETALAPRRLDLPIAATAADEGGGGRGGGGGALPQVRRTDASGQRKWRARGGGLRWRELLEGKRVHEARR